MCWDSLTTRYHDINVIDIDNDDINLIVTFERQHKCQGVQSLLIPVSSSIPAPWRPWMSPPRDADLTRTERPVS